MLSKLYIIIIIQLIAILFISISILSLYFVLLFLGVWVIDMISDKYYFVYTFYNWFFKMYSFIITVFSIMYAYECFYKLFEFVKIDSSYLQITTIFISFTLIIEGIAIYSKLKQSFF